MHELSLMESALESAERHAREHGATRIHALTLTVGALSAVVPEALELAFEAASPGTMAEGAALTVNYIPLTLHCPVCRADFEAPDLATPCPGCGGFSTVVSRGEELHLVSLEIS